MNCGRREGLSIALLSGIVLGVADFLDGHDVGSVIPAWNSAISLGFFLVLSHFVAALEASLKRETLQARSDSLTGVANSRAFVERTEIEMARCRRNGCPITVSFLDLDDFKTVNDTRGHVAGDKLLQIVALALKKNVRENDLVARMGGDEFMILLPDTGEEAARWVIERVFGRLGETLRTEGFPVTFSAGVVTFSSVPENFETLVSRADNLMYDVKNSGKDGVKYIVA